jgi:hypothetical protein
MKTLHRFTVNANAGETMEEMRKIIEPMLAWEAELQGWTPGFECKYLGAVDVLGDGNLLHGFEVVGEWTKGED